MAARRRLTTADINRIPEMRAYGMTWCEIAEIFHVSVSTARIRCFAQCPDVTHHRRSRWGRVVETDLPVSSSRHNPATIGELTAQPAYFENRITMARLMAGR
jgi:hypothetical protein